MTFATTIHDTMMQQLLIVDDNQKFLAVLQEFLSEYDGINIARATSSGQEALEWAADNPPDLVIVDLWMPDMGGLELTRQVKSRWPEIPVIVLTLFDSERHRQAAFDAGANAFVAKSRMDSDLLPAIRQLLGEPQ